MGVRSQPHAPSAVVGVDPSSRKLAIAIDDGIKRFEIVQAPRSLTDRGQIIHHLYQGFQAVADQLGEMHIFLEAPVVGRGGAHSTIVQAQAATVVHLIGVTSSSSVLHEVNNKRWKKVVVGSGNADKAQIRAWLTERESDWATLAADDQDLVDAACILLYGQHLLERGELLLAGGLS